MHQPHCGLVDRLYHMYVTASHVCLKVSDCNHAMLNYEWDVFPSHPSDSVRPLDYLQKAVGIDLNVFMILIYVLCDESVLYSVVIVEPAVVSWTDFNIGVSYEWKCGAGHNMLPPYHMKGNLSTHMLPSCSHAHAYSDPPPSQLTTTNGTSTVRQSVTRPTLCPPKTHGQRLK